MIFQQKPSLEESYNKKKNCFLYSGTVNLYKLGLAAEVFNVKKKIFTDFDYHLTG